MQNLFDATRDSGVGASDIHDDFVIVASPTHPQARKLVDFWHACAKKGVVVGRDVPSRPIADILSNLVVNEPVDGGNDLRIRLAGESVRPRFGGDIKGKLLSDLFPPHEFRHHMDATHAALRADAPLIMDSRLTDKGVVKLHLEVVILPVLAADFVTRWVLTGVFFF